MMCMLIRDFAGLVNLAVGLRARLPFIGSGAELASLIAGETFKEAGG